MPASGTQTILVVDNDHDAIDMFSLMLKRGGYNVISASNGPQALEQARAAKPDLIIMHVSLGGMYGDEVCRRLKDDAATKDIPIVLNSADDSALAREAALQAGAEDFLTKPIRPQELWDTIDSALKRRLLGIH